MKYIRLIAMLCVAISSTIIHSKEETFSDQHEMFLESGAERIEKIVSYCADKVHRFALSHTTSINMTLWLFFTSASAYSAYRGAKRIYKAFKESREAYNKFENHEKTGINYRKLPRNIAEFVVALVATTIGTWTTIWGSAMICGNIINLFNHNKKT
jgi:hypothetical protein